MKTVSVSIKGISPLLMHRFPFEPIEAIEKKSPEEQAKLSLYEHEGRAYVPGENFRRALVAAAAFSKGKGRGSLQKNVAAGLFINEERMSLDGGPWVIDSRPVVIAATRGRILRHRPKFEEWALHFTLSYDETLLTEQQVRRIVDDAGQRVGLLDFRPERKGSFGRFMVTKWESA